MELNTAKRVVREYCESFDLSQGDAQFDVLSSYVRQDYFWRGMHPFYEQRGVASVIENFWKPFKKSFTALQRREDFFFAGVSHLGESEQTWVLSAGHFMGLFDKNWLGIPSTGKIAFLRYAEFHRVDLEGKISETAFFCDILGLMHQAGCYPLPPMTGATFIYPGPRTHDGVLLGEFNSKEGEKTLQLVEDMADDLHKLNRSEKVSSPADLEKFWHQDMIWYGPTGIGATYTIPRYQEQHQSPFRTNLRDKVFNGHIARFAEGDYCAFFGWPNLNNRNKGGFLGLPANDTHAPMRVVDIYRRSGNRLAENWVYVDMLHYLYEQNLDVLSRMREIHRTK